jgi:hypothetical protein
VKENLQMLQRNASADWKWRTVKLARSARDGTANINVTKNTLFNSVLPPRLEQGQGLEVSYVETVDVVTLDTIIDRQRALVNERRPILKMGTQGLGSECV